MAGDYEKGIYNQLMDVMARLDSFEQKYNNDVGHLNAEIDTLTKENTKLRLENKRLFNDNERLKSIINNDSSNTSLPPSTDQKSGRPANTFNSREKTKKKTGGQKGHKGTTLTKAEVEEKIKSGRCNHILKELGDPASKKYVTKYVVDLDIKVKITELRIYADHQGRFQVPPEYHSDVTYGPELKALVVALYSEGVMSNDRIAAFLNAASGDVLSLSAGSVYGYCRKFGDQSFLSIQHLEASLLNHDVVATDATNVTVNGKPCYIRNFSTAQTVIYRAMKGKSIPAMKKLSFLERFSGILIHDHETAMYHFGVDHAECNVHLIRYLKKNTEETKHNWSDQMTTLLSASNKARKKLLENGICQFDEESISAYEDCYDGLVAKGRFENKATEHKYAQKGENTLLNRMVKYKRNHLLFLHNFSVLFDNNISERDLRKVKNRQKMAGGFRKDSGHKMYCDILTIVETLKRRGMGIIQNIKMIFEGTPAIF